MIQVTVDDRPLALPPAHGGGAETLGGRVFEWGYEGGGPYQLSLAILADHFDDSIKANEHYRSFCESVVSQLDDSWQLTSSQIDGALEGVVRVDMTFEDLLRKLRGAR
ncbi:DUF6166 domain-containing protein [Varunaivibrio sulfuroxidans]|uniref:DUF6166 domain-containing protein n=1 Tax=Varunaivibrio sulfuroxidans TaxID=1773489 RepID=UPI0010440F42|nr:DUF6166 domain-containing protein [Varunaivibrio sulfuroxidans]WES31514.1 DUF6166 domain-containing protein [Varunaivibrio sulfuroxidans]